MKPDQSLQQALEALGLSANAIALYTQSFQSGRATVGRLAALCDMDRSSAHLAANQLRAAGLLNEAADGGRTLVWAKPPKEVLSRLRLGIRNLRNQFDAIEDALPALEAAYAEGDAQPRLEVFSGKDGLRQVISSIMDNAGSEILLMTNQAAERQVFTARDHQEFIRERLRRGIRIRVLAADTPEAQELIQADASNLRETRILAGDSACSILSETYIFGDCVAMLSFSGVIFGFIVRSADFAQAQRWIFEQLWQEMEV